MSEKEQTLNRIVNFMTSTSDNKVKLASEVLDEYVKERILIDRDRIRRNLDNIFSKQLK